MISVLVNLVEFKLVEGLWSEVVSAGEEYLSLAFVKKFVIASGREAFQDRSH